MTEQSKSYINKNGSKFWYLPSKGKTHYHRLDGPAVERKDGTKQWWVNGKQHRLDGPAVEFEDGSKHWFINDKRHRLDGPAIEDADGTKWWWVNDELHRLDGPAIEWIYGSKEWYVNDKQQSTEEIDAWLEENNVDLKTEEGQMAFKLRWL